MRTVIARALFIASVAAVVVTMAMNGSYQFGQGATTTESFLRALAMAVFDCVKAGLPVGFALWWSRRQWGLLVVASALFLFCFTMSLSSAIGFYATSHGRVTRDREGITIAYRDARREAAALDKRLAELGSMRPEAVVTEAINALQTDRRLQSSKACTEATTPTTREFCREYFALRGELAAAQEVARLQARGDWLKLRIADLARAGAERDSDPQATALHRLLSFMNLADVKVGIDVLPSLLLEMVAAFGLVLASSMMTRPLDAWPRSARAAAGVSVVEPVRRPMSFKTLRDGRTVIDG